MKQSGVIKTVVAVLIGISVLLNVAARISTDFSDFYTDNLFPKLTTPYARLTARAGISVGEVMLIIFALIISLYLIAVLFRLVLKVRSGSRKKEGPSFRGIDRFMAVFLSFVLLLMTLNCFILYYTSPISVSEVHRQDYTVAELAQLRDYIVEKCNEMSEQMERDTEGNVVYEGDMRQMARASMEKLSKDYKRLGGFYTTPKDLTFSGFMSQQ